MYYVVDVLYMYVTFLYPTTWLTPKVKSVPSVNHGWAQLLTLSTYYVLDVLYMYVIFLRLTTSLTPRAQCPSSFNPGWALPLILSVYKLYILPHECFLKQLTILITPDRRTHPTLVWAVTIKLIRHGTLHPAIPRDMLSMTSWNKCLNRSTTYCFPYLLEEEYF